MPTFDQVPLQEVMLKTATGKTAQITQEYLGYIGQLPEGQAGRLQPEGLILVGFLAHLQADRKEGETGACQLLAHRHLPTAFSPTLNTKLPLPN